MVSAFTFFGSAIVGKLGKAVFEELLTIRSSLIFSAVPVFGSEEEYGSCD